MSSRAGGVLLAIALIAASVWLFTQEPLPVAPIEPGRMAPGFALPDLSGSTVTLAGLEGQVVLVNFWATWCKPCEDEMPAMQRLYQALEGEPFEMVAISVDEPSADVAAFAERLGLSFPILLDPGKDSARDYQSYKYPETYLVDSEGVLVARYVGPREWDSPEYEARIRRLLASAPPQ